MEEEDHVNEVGVGGFRVHRGVGAGDADASIREDLCDFSDDAGAVGDVEADVVGGFGLLNRHEAAFFRIGKEAAVTGGLAERAGGFDEVADDG